MATAKPALSLYSDSPEGQSAIEEYRQTQQRLIEALEGRQNQLFDPKWLAIAQAFGTPTKTGAFGEVLGNVAGALGTSQQAEEKRAQEIAKMRFELAQQGLGIQQRSDALRKLRPPVAGAPEQGAPAGPSAGAETTLPSSQVPPVQKPAALSAYSHITPDLALDISLSDPELGKPVMQYIEAVNAQKRLAQEAVKPSERGVFIVDPSSPTGGKFVPAPGRATVSRFLPGTGGMDMTESDAEKFDNVRDLLSQDPSNQAAQKELSRLVTKYRGSVGAAPSGGATPAGPMTPAEAELEKEEKRLTMQEQVKAEEKRREDIIQKASSASTMLPTLRILQQAMQGPNAKDYMGVFERAGFASAVAKVVEPSIPNIRAAFTQAGLDEKVKAEELFVMQQIALVNLEMRKIMRSPGEGSQSDLENRLALSAGVDLTDTPQGLYNKAKFLEAKRQFDIEKSNALEKSKMKPSQFENSPMYQNMLRSYEGKLSNILGLAAPKGGDARQKLRQELGIQ